MFPRIGTHRPFLENATLRQLPTTATAAPVIKQRVLDSFKRNDEEGESDKKSQSSNKVPQQLLSVHPFPAKKCQVVVVLCHAKKESDYSGISRVNSHSLTLSPLLPSSTFGHSLLFRRRRGESSLPSPPPQKSLIEICPFWSFLLRASAPLA